MDFGREPAVRAADGLVATPFLALCGWALTMVASIIAYSLSGSSARALKRFSQTPFSAQREKRLCVLLQPPKRSGKSRHSAPARNFQITASTKSRLPDHCCAPPCPDGPAANFQSAQTGRPAIHSVSSQSLLKEGSL